MKTCNYNCVYCRLGRTRPMTNQRRDYLDADEILAEAKAALDRHRAGQIDYVTFVGQGEPLLCASLGRLVRGVKSFTELPVAVITNGSLLLDSQVRDELGAADVVMPSLDAADEPTFRRIARPWPGIRVKDIIKGLTSFREEFAGQLWVEVMLVRGLNDDETTLQNLRDALARFTPDQVHVNTPIRPPAERWVKPPEDDGMIRALTILGEVATVVGPTEGCVAFDPTLSLPEAIAEVIRRHPMSEGQILKALGEHDCLLVRAALAELESSGRARRVWYRSQPFWCYNVRGASS